ncbi:hypothetical protein [Bradyrhizobium sp. OAE829]|uniref:hypothetical protein n=1 Tax=Bradyrhizobium sp. OAE829 TaxID=2663807 RepID=UPI00339B0C01
MANAGVMSTAAANLVRKGVVLASSSLFLLAALAGCQPATSEGIKLGWFYRMVVELSHGGEPLNIEVIIGCGSQERQILGEGRSVRAIWAPYIFGVRTKNGEGVLVQSPNVCDRDFAKEPIPADFLPVVFWAPDAGNLEFLVAYLHESAYEQPVSKLKFHRATITEATEADYRAWRETKWKDNIVPIGSRREDHVNGRSYFRGEGFFPKGRSAQQTVVAHVLLFLSPGPHSLRSAGTDQGAMAAGSSPLLAAWVANRVADPVRGKAGRHALLGEISCRGQAAGTPGS